MAERFNYNTAVTKTDNADVAGNRTTVVQAATSLQTCLLTKLPWLRIINYVIDFP
jgi:hypothetical protein